MGRKGISVCLVMVLLLGSIVVLDATMDITPRVEAITIYVDDDYGSEDATHKMTIQAAVDAANPGDTVFVYNGIYIENVYIDKTLTLQGEDKNFTIVDGNNAGIVFWVSWANYVNISGFTFKKGVGGFSLVDSYYCIVNDNNMYDNDNGFGVSGNYNRIHNNTIKNSNEYGYSVYKYYNYIELSNTVDNETIHYYYNLHGTKSSPLILDGLNLTTPDVSTKGKINLVNCSHIIVKNCNLSNNLGPDWNNGVGLYLRNSENITVNNVTSYNNSFGIESYNCNNISINKSMFGLNSWRGVYFANLKNATIENNSFIDNNWGLQFTGGRDSIIKNNSFMANGRAIYFSLFSDSNIIELNNISGSIGITLDRTIENILIENDIATSTYALEIINSNPVCIMNSTFISNNNQIYLKGGGDRFDNITVFIINSSFNQSKIYFADNLVTLFVQWYLHINVTDSFGNPIPNITVSIEDNQNSLPAQIYTTDSEGYIRWLTQTEYTEWDTNGDKIGEKTYYTPNRITAWNETLMGYAEVNINESKEVNIVLGTPSFEIPLSAGWNLISLPLVQSDTTISTVLSSIAGNYDIVQWYNASDGKWHSTNDDLTDINHTMGFWIHMKTADTLIVNGTIPNTTSIQLYQGWNLVGNPSFCIHGIDDILSPIATKYTAVQQYDSWDSGDPWKHYHINKPSNLNDLAYMTSGRGYLLYVTEDVVWEVSNF